MADPAAAPLHRLAPPHDWEVLSLSMSASASLVCCCDACTGLHSGNSTCTKQSSSSSGLNWLDFGGSTRLGVISPRIAPVRSAHVEPFTEGWKPHLRSAVDSIPDHASFLGSEQSSFQGAYLEQQTCSPDDNAEPLVGFQKEVFMAGEDLITAGERILAGPNTDDADKLRKKKARKAQATWVWQAARKPTVMLSIALAATVLGIVVIRQRWQLEQHQNQRLLLELGAKEAKLNDLMYQINRLKEAVAGHGKVSLIESSIFSSFTDI